MGRPSVIPAEQKTRIVLSVLAGEMTIAEAARREKVREQSIGHSDLTGGPLTLIESLGMLELARGCVSEPAAMEDDY